MSVLAVLFYATNVADICDGFRIYVRRPSNEERLVLDAFYKAEKGGERAKININFDFM